MELLDVTLTSLQRRNRAAFVQRGDLHGAPDLVPGQKVVLRDEEGEFFSGAVVDAHEHEGDRRYLVHVGVRLPEEYAMKRLGRRGGVAAAEREEDPVQEMLDMLGEARDTLNGRVPSQRLAP